MQRLCTFLLTSLFAMAAHAQVDICDCVGGMKNGATKAECDALVATMDAEQSLQEVMECNRQQVLAGDVNFCNCTRAATAEPAFLQACQPIYDEVAAMSSQDLSAKTVACAETGR